MRILIVEDDKINRIALKNALTKNGYTVDVAENGNEGGHKIQENNYHLVITDLKLPGFDGIKVLEIAKKKNKECFVIVITGYATVETAVKALKLGAYDYLIKPYPLEELMNKVKQIEEYLKIKEENEKLKREAQSLKTPDFVGESDKIKKLLNQAKIVAETDATVLIEGESGTGKEVLARTIHNFSERKDKPFVGINCSAIPDSLFESELFGYKKGAFTGAVSDKKGFFEIASGGTLFIDDIDDMPKNVQVKILRVIQEREIFPVGSEFPVKIDIRIISATKKPLGELVKKGKFREDLFYRLNVVNLKLPPLRERKEDIPLLIKHFINKYNGNETTEKIIEKHIDVLMAYNWPGNIRELENFVQRICAFPEFPYNYFEKTDENSAIFDGKIPLDEYISKREREIILNSLEKFNWNISKTAEFLKIPRTTLRSKMQKYGIKKV
ncbi:two-component system, NtrC family, response regulator [Thermotomaculum hydrothermale]|uniref:Two-component system, NtrC family, response regulator n=1 Tax=Thermotomaculum hydrothermale TaxID=981385 RepID=A0A7R6PXQ4_9BACT|nr:sigma-54 dependent transcriptional regulator [Thermotomaculum hydrothermale]BBB32660.1 two-component system, NtrC family, response regulator [Thermotomaculum hydrothermale]